jgi:hypothetical protein
MYHRFDPQTGASSSKYKTALTDFDVHLQILYDAGFSLVALEDWLVGDIHLPEGRRPLIITIDDLFYADQISLDENSQPATYSGVGRLWQFSSTHPDFGFHVSLFYNFGDKGYANQYANGFFTLQDGWRQARAEALAWAIENGATPLNHFYEHPRLDLLSPEEILWQLDENEKALREALALVEKEYLAADLPNILALPYVVWPKTDAGKQVLYDYVTPTGAPVSAIMQGNDPAGARLFESPFSSSFDPWHVPRVNAGWEAVEVILEIASETPTAHHCDLGEFPGSPHLNPANISKAIFEVTRSGECPFGVYIVDQLAFDAQPNGIIQLSP